MSDERIVAGDNSKEVSSPYINKMPWWFRMNLFFFFLFSLCYYRRFVRVEADTKLVRFLLFPILLPTISWLFDQDSTSVC